MYAHLVGGQVGGEDRRTGLVFAAALGEAAGVDGFEAELFDQVLTSPAGRARKLAP